MSDIAHTFGELTSHYIETNEGNLEQVSKNINKIAIYYKQKVLDTTSLPISIAHFWDVFHTQYKSIPDIFPQKLIFTSIFHLNPGKAYITEKQLEMRAKVFAIFLSSNLDEEWEHLSKSHNIIL